MPPISYLYALQLMIKLNKSQIIEDIKGSSHDNFCVTITTRGQKLGKFDCILNMDQVLGFTVFAITTDKWTDSPPL